jgi:hypothetical protein
MSFTPLNEIEKLLVDAQLGKQATDIFLDGLLKALVYVPSRTPIHNDGQGLQPLFYERDGTSQMAMFTDRSRIGSMFTEVARYCLEIQMSSLLRGIPDGIGLVINPAHTVGLEISADGTRRLKEMQVSTSRRK